MGVTFGCQEVFERAPDLVAHQDRVFARCAKTRIFAIRQLEPQELTEKFADAVVLASRYVTGHTSGALSLLDAPRLSFGEPDGVSQGLAEHAKRRTGAHRIAPA